MGASRISYSDTAEHTRGRTDKPTHYRVWREKEVISEDEGRWFLDGVDDVGNMTDDYRQFFTAREAWEGVPEFAAYNPLTKAPSTTKEVACPTPAP